MKHIASNVKGFVRKYYKKAGSVAVIAALGIVSFASVTGERMRESTQYGRMIAISGIETEAANENEVQKISYDDMVTMCYESDQLAEIEKSEKNYEEVLLAEKQDAKNKAALTTSQKKTTTTTGATTVTVKADGAASGQYLGQFVVTAYCPCSKCCGKSTGITASGTTATAGRTIATSSQFAFGTQLVINGNVYTVEDRGGSIKGNRIDVFCSSHQEALNYGRQVVDVYAY